MLKVDRAEKTQFKPKIKRNSGLGINHIKFEHMTFTNVIKNKKTKQSSAR
jgi:hypothetical protein